MIVLVNIGFNHRLFIIIYLTTKLVNLSIGRFFYLFYTASVEMIMSKFWRKELSSIEYLEGRKLMVIRKIKNTSYLSQ